MPTKDIRAAAAQVERLFQRRLLMGVTKGLKEAAALARVEAEKHPADAARWPLLDLATDLLNKADAILTKLEATAGE